MRKIKIIEGEYYHIYNRGVDKRDIFMAPNDLKRFFKSMIIFNTEYAGGGLHVNSFRSGLRGSASKLVEFVSYCLNSNHYHFLVKAISDSGVNKFMHRVSTGYTRYFNDKYQRTGCLFEGRYKNKHIDSNHYLLHLSAYINLNNTLRGSASKLSVSSWEEYKRSEIEANDICIGKNVILDQFVSLEDYRSFASDSIKDIQRRKSLEAEPLSEMDIFGG